MSTRDKNNTAMSTFLQRKDLKSFKDVYHMLYTPLCSYLSNYLTNTNIIEDVVQESFMTIWEKRHTLNNEMNLSAYMYSMVRNKGLNAIRNKTREVSVEEEAPHNLIEEDESLRIIQAEVYKEILGRIDDLPERAKQVFKLSIFSRLRDAEVAERLNISINSVKTHKKRARAILRKQLKNVSFSVALMLLLRYL